MSQALRIRSSQAQQGFTRALSAAWRNGVQLHDPSLWQFRDPDVEEKMLRDADIQHAVGFRRKLIAGRDWNLLPKDDTHPSAAVACQVGTALLRNIQGFAQARMNLARAFFSGSRFARIHGTTRVMDLGDGVKRLWWLPTRLEDFDKKMYRIVPKNDDGKLSAHWERWDVGKAEYVVESLEDADHTIRHVYEDDQATLGHGSALREALGWWWYAKEHVFQESLAAVERFAQGIITAKVDGVRDAETGLPNTELISSWTNVLENVRARHVLVHDSADSIEIIQGGGQGWQMLSEMRAELRSTIHTLILGANLTTSANEGGSYALAEVQENSTEALIQFDRESLQETLTKSLLGCVWRRNWKNLVELGIETERPLFNIVQEKRQDPVQRAQVAAQLSQMGVDLSLAEILDQTGFSMPEEGEPIVTGGSAYQPGGGFPSFDLGLGLDAAPLPEQTREAAPPKPEPVEIQDTALNGAQVTAAADLIDRVVQNTLPAGVALEMLVSMFNLHPDKAKRMVDEAAAFTPAAPVKEPAATE